MAANDCKLQERVDAIEVRVGRLEDKMNDGFASLDAKFDTVLASVVAEKVKWGDTVRSIVTWAARVILLGAAAAMGMTAYKMIFVG